RWSSSSAWRSVRCRPPGPTVPSVRESPRGEPGDEQQARFHVDLLRVDQVDRPVLEERIGEDAVHVEDGSGGVGRVVEQLPSVKTDDVAEIRGNDGERDEIQSNGAERVLEGLRRRPDWHQQIEQAEMRRRREKDDRRVQRRYRERRVA